jgi:hypothetical protein
MGSNAYIRRESQIQSLGRESAAVDAADPMPASADSRARAEGEPPRDTERARRIGCSNFML